MFGQASLHLIHLVAVCGGGRRLSSPASQAFSSAITGFPSRQTEGQQAPRVRGGLPPLHLHPGALHTNCGHSDDFHLLQGVPSTQAAHFPISTTEQGGCTRWISPLIANVMVQGPRPSCTLNDWTHTQYGDSRTGLGHVRPAPFIGRVTCPVTPVLDGCGVGCKPALGEWLVHSNN